MLVFYKRCCQSQQGPCLRGQISQSAGEAMGVYYSHHPQNPRRIYTHFSRSAWLQLARDIGIAEDRALQCGENLYRFQEDSIAADRSGRNLEPRNPVRKIGNDYEM